MNDIKRISKKEKPKANVFFINEEAEEIKSEPVKNRFKLFLIIIFCFVIGMSCFAFGYYYGKGKGINIGYYQANLKNVSDNQENSSSLKTSTSQANNEKAGQKEYIVKAGDTLFSIGLKYDMPWTEIAEANGLSEDSVITEGQKIKIPTVAGANNSSDFKEFTLTDGQIEIFQKEADKGINLWRLDPIEVSKKIIPDNFGISNIDVYSLISKNNISGSATVEINHEGKLYEAELSQPGKKGTNGIWIVNYVKGK